ncbi:hypothetical protein L2D37_11555 [Vibrio harveyi]|uniref:hypothetical protein n=1 Tax=Vibrio harveyi TaxID=669 RepID=UPI002380ACDA|nr:hypothetical protein [Vibrio harveyi]
MPNPTPRKSGDLHVQAVTSEIQHYLQAKTLPKADGIASGTARFIIEQQSNISQVTNKFEADNSNVAPDLTLHLANGDVVCVNLFKIRPKRVIQPKNLGAKSFIAKYFGSASLQSEFNDYFAKVYRQFLLDSANRIVGDVSNEATERELKRLLKESCPKFTQELEEFRSKLLYELREKCFGLFLDEYNQASETIEKAFNSLFMTDSFNVITQYDGERLKGVKEFKIDVHEIKNVSISKVGSNSVGITADNITLLIRFKFESGPDSAIKLATSYATPKAENKIAQDNARSLQQFNDALSVTHKPEGGKANSNAIGKCSEAIFYAQLLKVNPNVIQLDNHAFIEMFAKYSPDITATEFEGIRATSVGAVDGLSAFLKEKHGDFKIDSIELVPDAYLDNRLNTADIELVLRVGDKYVTEPISLKAIAKATNTINCKNPGIGQILGNTYFDLRQEELNGTLEVLKETFINDDAGRSRTLECLSGNIGKQLANAVESEPQKLIKGTKALLGSALVVVVYYADNKYAVLEHDFSITKVQVQRDTPSLIQNTLSWSHGGDQVRLRVKFSGGQSHGWTSIKLACAYTFAKERIRSNV